MAAFDLTLIIVWPWMLYHSIPSSTRVNTPGELLIAAFPLLMAEMLIDAVVLGFWMDYVVFMRGERLRREINEEREGRDTAIADAVAARLKGEK